MTAERAQKAPLGGENAQQRFLYEEYHPYGSTSYRASPSGVEVSARRYRYTGKERDEETGLYYYGARYYAAWLGRWTSADPLGLQAGINLYLYCRAGPVTYVDPDGMDVGLADVHAKEASAQAKREHSDYLAGAQSIDPKAPTQSEWHPEEENQSVAPEGKKAASSRSVAPAPSKELKPDDLEFGPGFLETEFAEAWSTVTNENAPTDLRASYGAELVGLSLGGVQLEMIGRGIFNIPYNIAKGGESYGQAATTENPDEALRLGLQGAEHLTLAAASLGMFETAPSSGAPVKLGSVSRSTAPKLSPEALAETEAALSEAGVGHTTVYHGGILAEVEARSLSTTPILEHAEQYAAMRGGDVTAFRIPTARFAEMMDKGLVTEIKDLLEGTSTPSLEYRFKPSVAPEVNQYRVRR